MPEKQLKFLKFIGKPFLKSEIKEVILGIKFKHLTVVISTISELLTKYQRLYNFGYWKEDLNVLIVVPTYLEKKHSENDPETLIEIVYKIVEQFTPPSFNVNFMFCSDSSKDFNTTNQYGVVHMRNIWKFKDRWVGDGNYITILKHRNDNHHQEKFNIDFSFIENQAEKLGVEVKYVNYGMKFDDMKETLLHTKILFVPTGGFIPLAIFMDVPFCKVNEPFIEAFKYKNGVTTFISGNETLGMTNCTNFVDNGKIQQKCFKEGFMAISTQGDNENILSEILNTNNLEKLYNDYINKNEQWVAAKFNEETPFDMDVIYE